MLEIAWSEDGEFPWSSFANEFGLDEPRWRKRIGRLWKRGGDEPVWDAAPEVNAATQVRLDAMRRGEPVSYPGPPPPAVDVVIPRIAPLVEDCLQTFRQFGMPIFEQVARHRGLL